VREHRPHRLHVAVALERTRYSSIPRSANAQARGLVNPRPPVTQRERGGREALPAGFTRAPDDGASATSRAMAVLGSALFVQCREYDMKFLKRPRSR